MKSKGKYVLCVLMAIIAIPTVSVIVPHAFATVQQSDTVTGTDQQPIIIPESEEGALVPVSTAQYDVDPTIISLQDPPGEHGGARTSDFLIYDPNQKICPLFPNQVQSTVCFVSDEELGSIEPVISNVQHFFTIIKIDETGAPQDVSSYLNAKPGSVIVFSDVEVNPQIPEFPIPFSMIIIFVTVAAVYIAIRQKMIPGFKI